MNSKQIKEKVCLYEYIEKYYGVQLERITEDERVYKSIFVDYEQKTGSLFVNINFNIFQDFATKKSGNILDFVCLVEKCNIKEAIEKINNNISLIDLKDYKNEKIKDLDFKNKEFVNKIRKKDEKSSFEILTVENISNKLLIDYLESRKINYLKVIDYIKEVKFVNLKTQKIYFGIGFENLKGGYEIRGLNRFKTSIGKKTISYICNEKEVADLVIFEGFFDFLSFFQYVDCEKDKFDYLILNSVNTINLSKDNHKDFFEKLLDIKKIENVFLLLDNDEVGKKNSNDFSLFFESLNIKVINLSEELLNTKERIYKDFNEFYIDCYK